MTTHYVPYPDPQAEVQVAVCYVRIPSAAVSQTPSCPWCQQRLKEGRA